MTNEQPTPVCPFCGDTFTPRHPNQVYDSYDCRWRMRRQVLRERKEAEKAAAEALAAAQ